MIHEHLNHRIWYQSSPQQADVNQEKNGTVNLLDDYTLHQISSSLVRIRQTNAFITHKTNISSNYIKLAT